MDNLILPDCETEEFTPAVIGDRALVKQLIAERQASGGDRFDEVWEGSYFLSPLANYEHQSLAGKLTTVFAICLEHLPGAEVLPGVNVSSRDDDWSQNYRCPDVAVMLPDSAAKIRQAYVFGGPDLCVEIVSPGDRSRAKLKFYAAVGVRELLILDRRPWKLELYRLHDSELRLVGVSDETSAATLACETVDVSLQLQASGGTRPTLKVRCERLGREWAI